MNFSRVIPSLVIFVLSTPILSCQTIENPPYGTVKTVDGKSLRDVLVCQTSWFCQKTDSEGKFKLDSPYSNGEYSKVIRFSRDGFQPITIIVPSGNKPIKVTLEKSNKSTRSMPVCQKVTDAHSQLVGLGFKVLVPQGVRVVEGSDIDYQMITICIKPDNSQCLIMGAGASWSSGLPSRNTLEETSEMVDLNLINNGTSILQFEGKPNEPILAINGVDIQGAFKEGGYWRQIGSAFETVSYGNWGEPTPKETAEFFDKILDTLCVVKRASE